MNRSRWAIAVAAWTLTACAEGARLEELADDGDVDHPSSTAGPGSPTSNATGSGGGGGQAGAGGNGDSAQSGTGSSAPSTGSGGAPPAVSKIFAAPGGTCAIVAGEVRCWGQINVGIESAVAVAVPGLPTSDYVSMAMGRSHLCALDAVGVVRCWGSNLFGQLGNPATSSEGAIGEVIGLPPAVAVTAGERHTCAITVGGALKCWGDNQDGALGDHSHTNSPVPVDVANLSSGVLDVSAGSSFTCALLSGGATECWGMNDGGLAGLGGNTPADVLFPSEPVVGMASGVQAISAGSIHACAILASDGLECWGSFANGALGHVKDHTWGSLPGGVPGLGAGVSMVRAGYTLSCALTTAGGVKCWGNNVYGQLGNGTTGGGWAPVDVVGLQSGVVDLAVGEAHACALLADGRVRCWGLNIAGQLGDGTTTDSAIPVDVVGL